MVPFVGPKGGSDGQWMDDRWTTLWDPLSHSPLSKNIRQADLSLNVHVHLFWSVGFQDNVSQLDCLVLLRTVANKGNMPAIKTLAA